MKIICPVNNILQPSAEYCVAYSLQLSFNNFYTTMNYYKNNETILFDH